MAVLLRGSAMILFAVVVGVAFAVNALLESLVDVLTRSDAGGW